MKTRKKWFAALIAMMMVVMLIPTTAWAVSSENGKLVNAFLKSDPSFNTNSISVNMESVTFEESLELQLYSNETLLTKVSLNTKMVTPGTYEELTGFIGVKSSGEYWIQDAWNPQDALVPTEVRLCIDGKVVDSVDVFTTFEEGGGVKITDKDWISFPGTAGGNIVHSYLNESNGRITVDMKDIYFEDSVVLKLYSGDKELTESSLDTTQFKSAEYGELTGSICISGTSSSWLQETWNPTDGDVPDSIKLFIDGQEVSTSSIYTAPVEHGEVVMTDENWWDFPGTECVFNEWKNNDTEHWKVCVCGNEDTKSLHIYGDWKITQSATEDTDGQKERICTECGYKQLETISAHVHELELKNNTDATCTNEGYTGDKVCTICGEVVEEGTVIEKVAHNYKDGKCTVCGALDPDYNPVSEPEQTTDPETKPGDTDEEHNTDVPQTGDNSNIALLVVLMGVGAAGIVGAVLLQKRRKIKE